jgi:pyridoxamine 5'-phosphate oxidase
VNPDELADLRRDYVHAVLDEQTAEDEPFAQFGRWFAEAVRAQIVEPHAMTLATADADGVPSARVVLLRAWDEHGFVFFTNYGSRKGRELDVRPRAALVFYWAPLDRQVRIDGTVERLAVAASDAYFARRPRGHRVSAWASPQSEPIANRTTLERAVADVEARFAGIDVPRPAFWGGYRVVPEHIEFWQGRPNRVHDRLAYARTSDGWARARLAP